jgi:hypothetical protein
VPPTRADPALAAATVAQVTDGWDEEALAALVTRDVMIGVALPVAKPVSA